MNKLRFPRDEGYRAWTAKTPREMRGDRNGFDAGWDAACTEHRLPVTWWTPSEPTARVDMRHQMLQAALQLIAEALKTQD